MASFDRITARWDGWRYALVRWRGAHRQSVHVHAEPRLIIVLEGALEEYAGACKRTYRPGTAIYRDARQPHSDAYGETGAYIGVALCGEDGGWLGLPSQVERPEPVRHPALHDIGLRLCAELRRPDSWSSVAARGLVFKAAATIGRGASAAAGWPGWVNDTLARMQADFESAWPSSRVARDAGLSAPHAAREFRRHTGRGIGEHVRRLRLAHARTLLAGSEPVATIAARAGFCDQSHLTRCFRAAFGVTPEHYRRSVRAGSIQTAPDLF